MPNRCLRLAIASDSAPAQIKKSEDGSGIALVLKTRLSKFRISLQVPPVAPIEQPVGKTVNRLIGCAVDRPNVPRNAADPLLGLVSILVPIMLFDYQRISSASKIMAVSRTPDDSCLH